MSSLDVGAHPLSPLEAQPQCQLQTLPLPQAPEQTHRQTLDSPGLRLYSVLSLPAPVARFCLGSDVSLPRGGTCPLPHPWVPEPAGDGWGRLGLGLGGQKRRLLLPAPRCAGPCAGHLSTRPRRALSARRRQSLGASPFAEDGAVPTQVPWPPAPPGSAQSVSDRRPHSVLQWSVTAP